MKVHNKGIQLVLMCPCILCVFVGGGGDLVGKKMFFIGRVSFLLYYVVY